MRKYNYQSALWLLGITVFMFLLQELIPGLTEALLLDSSQVASKPYLLLTSMFLHAGTMHLFFNMYALLLFGPLIEERIGTKRFLAFYLLAGIFAAIVTTFFYERALGASGAIMGILGITIMILPHMKILLFFIIPMSMRTAGILFVLIELYQIFFANTNIANAAHLAGLAVGLLYGRYLLSKRKQVNKKMNIVVHAQHPRSRKKRGAHDNVPATNESIMMNEQEIEDYLRNGRI